MGKMEFDKRRCMSAIYAIAKEKGVKIGDLEKEANVSKPVLLALYGPRPSPFRRA